MNDIYLVLGMALVTYIPRMLPMVLLRRVTLPLYIKRFMKLIPYAALGALIFPGVFTSAGADHIGAAMVGCGVSILLAWLGSNLIVVVTGGIAGTLLMNLLQF